MAQDAVLKLKLELEEAKFNLDEFQKEFAKLEKRLDTVTKQNEDLGKKLEQATNKGKKGVKGLGLTLKDLGKASGIVYLLTEAFTMLKEIFSSNQVVADTFKTAFNALALAFNDFFNFLNNNIGTIIGYFKSIFEDPVGSIKQLAKTLKDDLYQRVIEVWDGLGYIASAAGKLFKGDFKGALEDAKSAGQKFVDANPFVDAAKAIVEAAPKAVEAIKEYTTSTVQKAAAITKANKDLELSELDLQETQLQSQILAERQRQIRDDVTKSIADRIKANLELEKILNKQLENEKALAQQNIENIKLTKGTISQQEYEIKLKEANLKLTEIQERVEAQASEQKTNRAALALEQQELETSLTERQNKRLLDGLTFNTQLIESEYLRLTAQRDVLDKEIELETERLQAKIDLHAEGTQARQDAEQELQDFKAKKAQEDIELQKATEAAKQDLLNSTLGNLVQIFGQGTAAGKAAAIAQTTIDTYKAAQGAYAAMAGIPIVGPALGAIAAAAAVAGGIANVKKIQSIGPPTDGGAAQGAGSAAAPQAPDFNIVGAAPENQLAQVIGQKEQQPVKAFVVSSEVSSQQALDRNIEGSASLG